MTSETESERSKHARARAGIPTVQDLIDDAYAVQVNAAECVEKYKPDFGSQLKAIELQAKLCGYLDRITDEQLDAALARRARPRAA